MTDFKAKMHQIRFRLGLCPRPHWGAYSAPPDPLLDLGAASRQGEGLGWGRGGRGRGGKGRAPKLLLNQGPSETCYATGEEHPACKKLGVGLLVVMI